jgi:predicted unusual protein kinase regulating ubiquinone biosynthesis (AarF/ABC1/UbiB family)
MDQESIPSTKFSRIVALTGAGAKVSMNYLKHYGKRALGGKVDSERLHERNATAIYKIFSEIKGGPLKLAQMLSIDKNLLPPAYAKEFAQAQYSAPPLSYPLVVKTFHREFGKSPAELFDTFTQNAAHGASIGQVHRATIGDRAFAVKVQYPGVAKSLQSDLNFIKPIALQILGLKESQIAPYIAEVEKRLLEETDYTMELMRSIDLSRRSGHLPNVRFPIYYPDLSSPRILTLDWIDGVPLDQFADSPSTSQAERDRIGQALWDFYDYQIHTLNVFHADPHPGNFLIKDGQLWVIDFGCTKQIDPDYYRKHFRFLDNEVLSNRALLEECLTEIGVFYESDSNELRKNILEICAVSIELLGRPFRNGCFDFGDESFIQGMYKLGEDNLQSRDLRTMKGASGDVDGVYTNRAYFGLYSLLARLRCRVETRLPEWLQTVSA